MISKTGQILVGATLVAQNSLVQLLLCSQQALECGSKLAGFGLLGLLTALQRDIDAEVQLFICQQVVSGFEIRHINIIAQIAQLF